VDKTVVMQVTSNRQLLPVSLTSNVLDKSKPNISPVDKAASFTAVCLHSLDHAMTGAGWSGEPM